MDREHYVAWQDQFTEVQAFVGVELSPHFIASSLWTSFSSLEGEHLGRCKCEWFRGKGKTDLVGTDFAYTPKAEDVARGSLTFRLTLYKVNGQPDIFQKSFAFVESLSVEEEDQHHFSRYIVGDVSHGSIRIMTWNVLGYTLHRFPKDSPPWTKTNSWKYRDSLIIKQIENFDKPEVVCLQEIQHNVIDHYLGPQLKKMNYSYEFVRKVGCDDGLLIAYKDPLVRVEPTESNLIYFKDAVEDDVNGGNMNLIIAQENSQELLKQNCQEDLIFAVRFVWNDDGEEQLGLFVGDRCFGKFGSFEPFGLLVDV